MPIPASYIVEVSPRVIGAGRSDLEMNGLFISTSEDNVGFIPFPAAVKEYTSAAAVMNDFGPVSDEYVFATQYFNGYVNKFMSPKALFIGAWPQQAQPSWLMGADAGTPFAELTTISNGKLLLTADGTSSLLGPFDFTAAKNLSEILKTINDGIAAVQTPVKNLTLEYVADKNKFVLISTGTGANTPTITVESYSDSSGSTDVGAALRMTATFGPVFSRGTDVATIDEAIAKIRQTSENWVTFTFDKPSNAIAGAAPSLLESNEDAPSTYAASSDGTFTTYGGIAANWAANNWGYLYIGYTAENPVINGEINPEWQADNTAVVYGTSNYAAFIMGAIGSIDWSRTNGTITLAFKSGVGLAATVTDEQIANELETANINFYGKYATRNAEFDFLYPGRLIKSDYVFIDPLVNAIWLNNALQVSIMNGLSLSPRVPYTQRGYALIRAWMLDPVNRAKNNGAIQAGVTLSESQKAQLMQEAGLDISGELFTQGYYIQILDPGAAARVNRETPIINLWYCYGGSVQRINVASTAIL